MRALKIIIAVLLATSPILASNDGNSEQVITDLPDVQLRVHQQSNIYFSVTNFGFLGSQGGEYSDSEGNFIIAPSAEFPAESEIEYLFQGAI